MAHSADTRAAARSAYVFERLTVDAVALKLGLPASTVTRWKRAAAAAGDDWERARATHALAADSQEALMRRLLTDYIEQHQATIDVLKTAADLDPIKRASALASLADSFNKTLSAMRRAMPETDRLSVALEVLGGLADFIHAKYPANAAALAEVIEAYGHELARGG